MDWTMKKNGSASLPLLERRSFFKIGAAAYFALTSACSSRTSRSTPSTLLKGEREWAPSVCTLCPSGCAIRAYSEGGRIVAVGGDPDDPNTGGKMCPIGLSMLNLHANPDRLMGAFEKSPDGKMTPAKADKILNFIVEQIRKGKKLNLYGRITPYASQLAKVLNAACHMDTQSNPMSAYPSWLNTDGRPPIYDFANAQSAFLFDSNILEHGYPYVGYVRRIADARSRGLRMVTLSPFLTNTATAGDWIPIRPLPAASLAALAIAQQATNDPELHISQLPSEIQDLLRSLNRQFIEKATGLSRETIQELSRRFFSEPGPAISDIPDPSVLLLNIMKGNLNRPGGLLHPGQRILKAPSDSGYIAEILRDPGNILLIHRSNPAFNSADEIRPLMKSSSKATVVCIDSFMSETAELSDFVLPLASPLETLTLTEPLPLSKRFLVAALPAVPPPPSCFSFDDWLVQLATLIKGTIPTLTPERFAAETTLGNSNSKLPADRAIYPMSPANTPIQVHMQSIKMRIADAAEQIQDSSSLLQREEYLFTAFEESVRGPFTAPSKWLDETSYSPKIYLHPQRAGLLGIRSGDEIVMTSGFGTPAEGTALLFEGVHPDALAVPLHHGHTAYGRVAQGKPFADSVDPDMSRIFWTGDPGLNPADIDNPIVRIRRKRG
jgi:anaerobic selenocysteine-containing dehydrogenase